ncbi:MAG: flagellar hook-length control protein FliK [Bacteroides sp.]|nr:flagellar hook-length control protein FliK [Bacteroides sp.]
MTSAAAINNLNNMETVLSTKNTETPDTDFSAVLENKTCTIGDIKNKTIDESDTLADFKEFLSQVTSEANVETSLNLTFEKDITESTDNLETEEETEESNIILFAQALETANHEITLELETPEQSVEIIETAADAETIEIKTEGETQELSMDEDMLKELNIESIKAETESSSDNSAFMNHQSAEEQGIKFALHKDSGIQTFDIPTPKTEVKPVTAEPSKIIEQVSKHLESLQHTSKVDIVLNPESLGKVTIQLIKSPEGLSAQFTTATQEARNILMKGLDGLKDTLTSHGVGVDNVAVKVNDTQKSEYNADWTEQEGSRGGNKEQNPQNREEKEKGLFEKTIAQQKENGKV